MILHDNVFDLQENVNVGYLWESLNTFKTIFNNTDIDDVEYNLVKENINNRPLLESNENLYGLRDILLEFDVLQGTWLGRQLKSSGEGIKDTLTQSWEGLKKFGVSISKNGWSQILSDISKGVRFVFRRLKDALYSNIGITVDAILVATGVGKTIQWIPWGMVFGLDVYQMANNDWEREMSNTEKWFELLFSSIGLLATGVIAKGIKKTLGPLMGDPKRLTSAVRSNKKLTDMLITIKSKLPNISGMFTKLESVLKGKFDAGAQFISQSKKYLSSVIGKFTQFIDTLLGTGKVSKGVKSGTTSGVVTYAMDGNKSGKVNNPLQTNIKPQFDWNDL